ncbi:MAG: right-handed parallel beta-helix repeat-containing protein [Anaerolineae bacterium]|nr:right-handed parallel beta-helix repeat-containing protein [Anaerolineae bacterium]
MRSLRFVWLLVMLALLLSVGTVSVTAGVDVQRSAVSRAAQYTPTYYVGPDNCSDDGAGRRAQPFCSVQRGLDALEPGDVLMLLDGVYHERVYVPESGTSDQPIVITGESHNAILDGGCPDYPCDARVILAGEQVYLPDDDEPVLAGFFVGWVEHIVLDGFTIRNAPTFGIEVMDTTGVSIQHMRVQNAIMSVVNVYDSYDFKLLHNEISGGNLGWITPEGMTVHITYEESVSIVNTEGFEIADNHVHDGFKEGVNVKVGTRNGSIHHNTIERLCAVGIYLTEVHNVEVYGNTVSDIGFIRNTMSTLAHAATRSSAVMRCYPAL